MTDRRWTVAVVGATGAVGREMLRMLEERSFPVSRVRALASPRSVGRRLPFAGGEVEVEVLSEAAFEGVDIALFSAGGARSLEFARSAVQAGAVVIDNSSAWRMDPEVPLVVPEVNEDALDAHRGIIANPNCSTIQMVLPLKALGDAFGLRRVIVSTYQSASGAGQGGIDELFAGVEAHRSGEALPSEVFARPLAFDCLPQIGDFLDTGYTSEEQKMLEETRKILSMPELPSSATCVRVPVARGHLESVTVDLERRATAAEAREVLSSFPGIVVMDRPGEMVYPVARDCVGRTETFVGRIREDNALPGTLHFWVVSDNLLKGAAWNAVQIAESLVARDRVSVPRG
ncbi:MAG: aspartate-semialdehyde dehydrogenase [Deltaproteobacteria bacterium]|nr:MAG: aspartate-semialdehyde dehydrogenase [Deltaproteobacteria bacterium]